MAVFTKSTQQHFKIFHWFTSKRRNTAMEEAIQKHDDNTPVNRNELHLPGEQKANKTSERGNDRWVFTCG